MKKLFIWGAGDIGSRVFNHLSDDWEIIFVDSKKYLTESCYYGRKLICFEEYLKDYSTEFILIAHLQEDESIEILTKNNIENYFIHTELPGEFNEPCTKDCLKKYVVNYLQNRNNYVLYGLNLYSIVVDEWLNKQYGYHPYILLQDNISKEYVKKIQEKYKDLRLIENIENLHGVEELCICLPNYNELKDIYIFSKYHIQDLFDCTNKIDNYYNPKIEKYHNLHKGKRCFIVATGPSLKIEDLDLLEQNQELCISMNSIYEAFDKTEWRPDYYVISDYRIFDEDKDLLDTLPVENKFFSDNSNSFWRTAREKDIYCYHHHYEYCFNRLPKFSDDFSRKSYTGTTVTYTCMQLAAYMGFKEIYLLGVDFTYGGQEKNVEYTHFYGIDKSGNASIGYAKHVALAYQSAKKYADLHGIKICNATRGGKLELFERVDFDSLFD